MSATRTRRVSYMLHFRQNSADVGDCLNALISLLRPEENHNDFAHISIPNLEKQGWSEATFQECIQSARFTVTGIRYQFRRDSSFLCFICRSTALTLIGLPSRSVHHKIPPHITIFSGSLRVTEEVAKVMAPYQYYFSFPGAALVLAKKQSGQRLEVPEITFSQQKIREITHEDLNPETIRVLPFEERLLYIKDICSYLSQQSLAA